MRLEKGGYHNLASFGPGDFFGELAFLDAGTRTAEAVAETDVQLFAISREVFDAICQARPETGTKLMTQLARVLAYRLRRADAELEALHEL
jgi:SulP family sulfate permease